jgi:hypothetical protein
MARSLDFGGDFILESNDGSIESTSMLYSFRSVTAWSDLRCSDLLCAREPGVRGRLLIRLGLFRE